MGQFEKIVVLSVIGLIAVILVVAFSGSEDPLAGMGGEDSEATATLDGELHGPLPTTDPRPIRGRDDVDPAAGLADALGSAPDPDELDMRDPFAPEKGDAPKKGATEVERDRLMLNAETVDPHAEEGKEEAALVEGLPPGAALVTLRGLEDTWEPDLKQYTCRRGDGLIALARRFYGEDRMESLLRQYNEGVELLEEGQVLLVPVFDLRAPGESGAPAREGSAREAKGKDAAPTGGGGVHVVGDGENLWGIAQDHYGRGSEWQKIYDANRDRLSNPDALRAGMTLRIP